MLLQSATKKTVGGPSGSFLLEIQAISFHYSPSSPLSLSQSMSAASTSVSIFSFLPSST